MFRRRILPFAISLLSICFISLISDARDSLYPTPIKIASDYSVVDSLPPHIAECAYHLRIDVPHNIVEPKWSVTLCYADSSTTVVSLHLDNAHGHDSDYASPLDVSIISYPQQTVVPEAPQSLRLSQGLDPSCSGWSLTLTKLPDSPQLICCVGQTAPLASFPVRLDSLRSIVFCSHTSLGLSRISLRTKESDHIFSSIVANADQVMSRLQASTDPVEALWIPLDQDTDPRRLGIGGKYTLATLMTPDSSIEIIYLQGAERNAHFWHTPMLKGRLIPTQFLNHYDLVWYDAFGNKIDQSTSADIVDNAILKLNFPLYGGSMRFRTVNEPLHR